MGDSVTLESIYDDDAWRHDMIVDDSKYGLPFLLENTPAWTTSDEVLNEILEIEPWLYMDSVYRFRDHLDMEVSNRHLRYLITKQDKDMRKTLREWELTILKPLHMTVHNSRRTKRITAQEFYEKLCEEDLELSYPSVAVDCPPEAKLCRVCNKQTTCECICGDVYCSWMCQYEDWKHHYYRCKNRYDRCRMGMLLSKFECMYEIPGSVNPVGMENIKYYEETSDEGSLVDHSDTEDISRSRHDENHQTEWEPVLEPIVDRTCFFCNAGEAPKMCGGCMEVFYCSHECQKKHWKSGHKKECKGRKQKKPYEQTAPSPQPCESEV